MNISLDCYFFYRYCQNDTVDIVDIYVCVCLWIDGRKENNMDLVNSYEKLICSYS